MKSDRIPLRQPSALALLLALAACDEPGAGGVTAEEAAQLNDAANMVDVEDASPDSLTAGEDASLGNGEAGSAETDDLMVVDNGLANSAEAPAEGP